MYRLFFLSGSRASPANNYIKNLCYDHVYRAIYDSIKSQPRLRMSTTNSSNPSSPQTHSVDIVDWTINFLSVRMSPDLLQDKINSPDNPRKYPHGSVLIHFDSRVTIETKPTRAVDEAFMTSIPLRSATRSPPEADEEPAKELPLLQQMMQAFNMDVSSQQQPSLVRIPRSPSENQTTGTGADVQGERAMYMFSVEACISEHMRPHPQSQQQRPLDWKVVCFKPTKIFSTWEIIKGDFDKERS
jgi:hypothetical protein